MGTTTGPIHFLNVEYFFRLLYEALTQTGRFSSHTDFLAMASQVWLVVTFVAIVLSLVFLAILIHSVLRYRQVLEAQEKDFATLDPVHAEVTRDHSRWQHVRTLIESPHESDWRQAIIEADIMLDDLLTQLGYQGIGVGEKLKAADPASFKTLQNAWEGHKVRNEIAHSGSAYALEEHNAHRTIAQYEAVMREFGEI